MNKCILVDWDDSKNISKCDASIVLNIEIRIEAYISFKKINQLMYK